MPQPESTAPRTGKCGPVRGVWFEDKNVELWDADLRLRRRFETVQEPLIEQATASGGSAGESAYPAGRIAIDERGGRRSELGMRRMGMP